MSQRNEMHRPSAYRNVAELTIACYRCLHVTDRPGTGLLCTGPPLRIKVTLTTLRGSSRHSLVAEEAENPKNSWRVGPGRKEYQYGSLRTHRQFGIRQISSCTPHGGVQRFSRPNYQQANTKSNTYMLKRTALVALPAIALLMGGCANTAQLKQQVEQAQKTADTAQKTADEAKRMAQDAKGSADKANDAASKAQADADEAKRMAGQARQDAAAAKSAADAANEKADRMFKKAMSK